jgi:two-component system osmolarity sensor histidine kinase EnvZ
LIDGLDRDLQQMNQLIANVLDLAQGLAHEPPQTVGLSELLKGLADEHATESRGVKVHCPHAELTVPVLALRRLLGNLLQNALRHAPDDDVDLVCLQELGMFRMGVLDRGPGIAPDQVESMFLPFQRGEPSRSPQTGGSGLGLAIVKELARANGWEVHLQPRVGGGLEAWVDVRHMLTSVPAALTQASSIR